MDKQAEYGTQNGQGIAGETVLIRPRAGALELARIVDATRAGQKPDPADVAAVKALHPGDEAESAIDGVLKGRDPADLIYDLHRGDFETRQAAWRQVAQLLPADVLRENVEIVDSWAELEAPAREWLIPAWLPAGRIGMVSGQGGKGKTWMLLQLAAAMASGEREWLGWASGPDKAVLPVEPGAAVFASSGDSDTARLSCEKASYAMRPEPVYLQRSNGTGWAWRASSEQTPPEAAAGAGQRQGSMRQGRQRPKHATGSSKGITGAEYGGFSGKNTL